MIQRPPPPDLPTRRTGFVAWLADNWPSVIRVAGLALLVNEAVWEPEVRPALLPVYAAMMGLPAVLAANDSARRVIEKMRDGR